MNLGSKGVFFFTDVACLAGCRGSPVCWEEIGQDHVNRPCSYPFIFANMYVRLTVVFFWKMYTSKFVHESYFKLLKCVKNCRKNPCHHPPAQNVFRYICMIFRFLFIYPGITRISDFLFDIFLLNSHWPLFSMFLLILLLICMYCYEFRLFRCLNTIHARYEIVEAWRLAANLKYPWLIHAVILKVWINWCNLLYAHLISVNWI